jgi:hypothetical protein
MKPGIAIVVLLSATAALAEPLPVAKPALGRRGKWQQP